MHDTFDLPACFDGYHSGLFLLSLIDSEREGQRPIGMSGIGGTRGFCRCEI